jgi:hypothetical protein
MTILTASHKLVAKTASRDMKRGLLTNVHIGKDRIEASDGVVYIRKDLEHTGEELLIQAAVINKGNKSDKELEIELDNPDTVSLCNGKESWKSTPQKGKYPNMDKLFRKKEPLLKVVFNRGNLQTILDSLAPYESTIKFSFFSPDQPVQFEVNDTVRGLIMPMGKNK